tara:strand:- start:2747 stop:4045 length:1299 start_codon:yes stop_codon:yes gene_type:complete
MALMATWERSPEIVQKYQLVPPGIHAWIVVPSFPQGRQAWNELMQLVPPQFKRDVNRSDMIMTLNGPGGDDNLWGQVEVKSAHDPETLQTVGLDFLHVSEAQDIANTASEKLRPTLRSPGRLGRAIHEGIPSLWPEHWFRTGVEAAKRNTRRTHAAFHFTMYDNPLLTEEDLREIEYDRGFMTEAAWRRMYLAEFSSSAGFFKNIDECIAGDLLKEPLPGASYVAGLDLGISRDFTVLHIMDHDERKVVFHQFWDSTPWTTQREHITRLCRAWGVQELVADSSGMGKALVQELEEAALPVTAFDITGANRTELLGELQVATERATITFPNIPLLTRQLRAFQYQRMKTGMIRAQAPPGEHDDEIFALALALTALAPAYPVAQQARAKNTGRYIPTQAEVNGGGGLPTGLGARLMRKRAVERLRERMERVEVE